MRETIKGHLSVQLQDLISGNLNKCLRSTCAKTKSRYDYHQMLRSQVLRDETEHFHTDPRAGQMPANCVPLVIITSARTVSFLDQSYCRLSLRPEQTVSGYHVPIVRKTFPTIRSCKQYQDSCQSSESQKDSHRSNTDDKSDPVLGVMVGLVVIKCVRGPEGSEKEGKILLNATLVVRKTLRMEFAA